MRILPSIFLILAITACDNTTTAPQNKDPRHAYVAAREFCKERLKSPRSAQFSSGLPGDSSDHDLVAREEWAGMWSAGGVVDSQNSFGGLMRTTWDAYVARVPQGWQLIYLRIGEQTVGRVPDRPKSKTELAAEQRLSDEREKREREARETLRKQQADIAEHNRLETARKVFESQLQRAVGGSPDAQYELALSYLNGVGTERDTEAGLSWLRFAAKQNHAPSIAKLNALNQESLARK